MSELPVGSHREIINRMKASIKAGKHWYLALVEAIRDYPEERFLIGGEALDWISLSQMLISETGEGTINRREITQFFNHGKPPINITPAEARQLVGDTKYNLYLNYLYGVTVEASLLKAVEAEIKKEFSSLGLAPPEDIQSRAFITIYEAEEDKLRAVFASETGAGLPNQEIRDIEFIYWLFKYRLKISDKEKVASDTKKALNWLKSGVNVFPRLFRG